MPKETTANAQTRLIERDLSVLGQRFDRHLEIYAQNGKELAGVKVSLDNINKTLEQRNTAYEGDQGVYRTDLKDHITRLNIVEKEVTNLGTRVALYATGGSAVASTAVGIAIQMLL